MTTENKANAFKDKVLQINLHTDFYGTIAEIGGGQEVARAFFQVGGASNTIAKSISAYDKTFSDNLYNKGKSERYVSEKRLIKMLDKEYSELELNLSKTQYANNKYFVFANTVETINYSKSNNSHGWLGVKFQLQNESSPNEVVIHVNLLEKDSILQQNTLGILGTNLIAACFFSHDHPNQFLKSLMDGLDRERVDINMIRVKGPDLNYVDNRLLCLQLVKNNMTNATVFDRYGNVKMPGDFLYKKNLMLLRGSFRPITYVGIDMLKTSLGYSKENESFTVNNTLQLCEITLNNLLENGEFEECDFLARVNLLNGMGQNVMITNFKEFYKLSNYISNFNTGEVRIIIGANILQKLIQPIWYKDLKGGLLNAMGLLFSNKVKLYIYPFTDREIGNIITSKNIKIDENIKPLIDFLNANGKIIDITDARNEIAYIDSRDVLSKIINGDISWEAMVPKYISKSIKKQKLFEYKS